MSTDKPKPKFRLGDKVITSHGELATVTRIILSYAYELDHYQYPYQPDEVKRKATKREIRDRR